MALFDFAWLRRGRDGADFVPGQRLRPGAAERSSESIERMRTRARQRLIGAAVLVVAGIVGFGLLFENQPRPASEPAPMPTAAETAPLVLDIGPQATTQATPAQAQPNPAEKPEVKVAEKPTQTPTKTTDKTLAQNTETVPKKSPEKTEDKTKKPAEKPAEKEKPKPADKPTEKPTSDKPKPDQGAFEKIVAQATSSPAPKAAATSAAEADRARALLEGRSPTSTTPVAPQRFIVQVGAFADMAKADEVRTKLRAHGIATFTQTVQTRDGPRIRVRVGPFNNRDEATNAAARVSATGFGASVMPQ